jgi:3-dehydroquinate synthase
MEDLVVDLGERSYPILIKKGLIDEINLEIKKIYTGKKVLY